MEVKIQIPDNCELIKDGDTYIVKEKNSKPKTWSKFCGDYPIQPSEYYIDDQSRVLPMTMIGVFRDAIVDKNCCTSKEEAEAFLALMQLRQLRKAWVGDWEPIHNEECYCIFFDRKNVLIGECRFTNYVLSFPTKEMAEEFLTCFRDLCETAKILL